jgi:hypothetical protein
MGRRNHSDVAACVPIFLGIVLVGSCAGDGTRTLEDNSDSVYWRVGNSEIIKAPRDRITLGALGDGFKDKDVSVTLGSILAIQEGSEILFYFKYNHLKGTYYRIAAKDAADHLGSKRVEFIKIAEQQFQKNPNSVSPELLKQVLPAINSQGSLRLPANGLLEPFRGRQRC